MSVGKQGVEWMERAMCSNIAESAAEAVAVRNEHTDAQTGSQRRRAAARCWVCPVFEECLTYWAEFPDSWLDNTAVAGSLWGPTNQHVAAELRRPITPDGQPDLNAALDLARTMREAQLFEEVG